jgi:hypothetical protein
MVGIPLQIAAREVLGGQRPFDGAALRVVSNTAQKTQWSVELMNMIGKIEGGATQAPSGGEHVEQYSTDGQDQTAHPFGNT